MPLTFIKAGTWEDCLSFASHNKFNMVLLSFCLQGSIPSAWQNSKKKDLLSNFKKGVKRDASVFNVLKDPKQWDSWHWSILAQAWAPDVSDVLNLSYKLPTGEQDLFKAKAKVHVCCLQKSASDGQRKSPCEIIWGHSWCPEDLQGVMWRCP